MKKTDKTIAQPAIGNLVQHIRRTNRPRQTTHLKTQTIPSASITTPTKEVLLKKQTHVCTKTEDMYYLCKICSERLSRQQVLNPGIVLSYFEHMCTTPQTTI